jgi:hypothetical protein
VFGFPVFEPTSKWNTECYFPVYLFAVKYSLKCDLLSQLDTVGEKMEHIVEEVVAR